MDCDVKTAKVVFMEGRHSAAVAMFRALASEGDAEAAFHYAFCRLFGLGCQVDESEAKSFFVFASGYYPEAFYNLSVMYMHGKGVPRDYVRSAQYMRDAAVGGVIEAQLYLGVAHTIGQLYEPDIIAISLIPYHTAIGADPTLLLDGDVTDFEREDDLRTRAVRFDPRAAFEWFRLAAKHSTDYVEELVSKGKFLYARCFVDGLGVDFDRDRANRLMLIAADSGSEDALGYLTANAPYVLSALENPEVLAKIYRAENLPPPSSED